VRSWKWRLSLESMPVRHGRFSSGARINPRRPRSARGVAPQSLSRRLFPVERHQIRHFFSPRTGAPNGLNGAILRGDAKRLSQGFGLHASR